MIASFKKQQEEIRDLNNKYKPYWEREFCGRYYLHIIGNPNNFSRNIFYHQANSENEKLSILKNGFNIDLLSNSNCGVGRGLYLGRDKRVLINFYNTTTVKHDYTIKIIWDFDFFDTINNQEFNFKQPNIETSILNKGFDGVRYYDEDATGEEFVLYNLNKIEFII